MQEYRETKSKIWRVGEVVKVISAARPKGLYKIIDLWEPHFYEAQGEKTKRDAIAEIIKCDKAGNETLIELDGKMVRVGERISIKNLAKV